MPFKRLIVLAWMLWATFAYGAAPTPVLTFCTAAPDQCRKGTIGLLAAKGTTDNVEYMVEVDTTTGELPVKLSGSTTVSLAEDQNYGVVGANTLRTAAQLGNATGSILYGTGASSAQVPRVVVSTDSTISAQNFPTTVNTGFGAPGASTIRAAAELGVGGVAVSNANPVPISDAGGSITVDGSVSATNFPATADTNLGAPGASTLRTAAMLGLGSTAVSNANPVPISDAGGSITIDGAVSGTGTAGTAATGVLTIQGITSMTPVTVSGTVAVSGTSTVAGTVAVSNLPTTADTNFGAPGASTLRAAAMMGVGATAVSNANPVPISDAGGSITVDGTVAVSSSALPTGAATETTLSALNTKVADDFGASAGAVRAAAQIGNATGAADFNTGAAGAQTLRTVISSRSESVATPLAAQLSNGSAAIDYSFGTPTAATVRTAAMMAIGTTAVSTGNPVPTSEQGHTYSDSARNDYTSTNVTTGAWVQLIASTAAAITQLYIDDTCGQVLELGTGAAASETRKLIIPRGGFATGVGLAIPAGTRVSLRAITATCSVGDITLTGLL